MSFVAAVAVRLGGRYTLLDKLGAGGQAEVWRARDHERGVEIALKILRAERASSRAAWEALEHEFAVASAFDHPFILKVYRPQRDADAVFLPMELASGGDLRRLRGASYVDVGPVLLELAEALDHVHARGFVHGDLKSANVLFDDRGHVRLADFGVAAGLGRPPGSPEEPLRAGVSPFSASPEQKRGEPPSVADDVYGFGALAYELLTGYRPFHPQLPLASAGDDHPPWVEPAHPAPDRLVFLVRTMLSAKAEWRPRSMRQVIERLEAALGDTLTFGEPLHPQAGAVHDPVAPAPPAPPAPAAPAAAIASGADREPPMRARRSAELTDRALFGGLASERAAAPLGGSASAPRPNRSVRRWPWILTALAAALAGVAVLFPRGLPSVAPWTGPRLALLRHLALRADVAAAARRLALALGASQAGSAEGAGAAAAAPASSAPLPATAPAQRDRGAGAPVDSSRLVPRGAVRQPPNRSAAVLSRLVEGLTAEIGHDDVRAAHDFERVLELDPGNPEARAGLERIRAAPVRRVRRVAEPVLRLHAASLPERLPAPRGSLKSDLARRMRGLIDEPGTLESQAVRDEAAALVREEAAMPAPGAELRSLAQQLAAVVSTYGKTVRVALISDDRTHVEITQIGSFGTFLRREIELRPGEYTVIGRRSGYKEVRRRVTIEPGAGVERIEVLCEQPI